MISLIINKYMPLLFLFTISSVCNSSESPVESKEERAHVSAPQILPKSLTTTERMERLKLILVRNPDITMLTVLPELFNWWNRDLQFVRSQLESRISGEKMRYYSSPSQIALQRIQLIDTMVQSNADHMSLAFLNFAWRLVVNALSEKEVCIKKDEHAAMDAKFNFNNDEIRKLAEVLNEYKFMIAGPFDEEAYDRSKVFSFKEIVNIYDHIRIQSGAFVIAHISKQGLVSIPAINEGLAFQVNDRAYAACFIGVGTNPRLEYDGEHGSAHGLWEHDDIHYVTNFPWVKNHEGKGTINDALAFKKRIKNVYDEPEVQLALYVIFHEGNQRESNDFAKHIKHCTENVQKESHLLPSFVQNASYYGSGERVSRGAPDPTTPLYLSAIKDAEWLKMNWPRKNGGTSFFYPADKKHRTKIIDELRQEELREANERYNMRAEEIKKTGTSTDDDLDKLRKLWGSEKIEIYDRYEIQEEEIKKIGTLGDQYLRFYLKGIQLIKQELLRNYISQLDLGVFDYKSAIGGLHIVKDHLKAQTPSALEWKETAKRNGWG
ncbi:MAG: hypothetical protein NWS47_03420 [Alphaproteobacteria bacterium]|nr:hypothetical protein [Alphaproteobacteria bacterium]